MSLTVQNPLLPQNMGDAMKLADIMSKAKLLPAAVQNQADAFLVINQAMRWGMDPFAVAQEVSVIQGKLMHSGKIVAAAIQSSGILQGRLHYDYAGSGDDRQVTVRGRLHGETAEREVVVKLRDARTQNRVWTTQPDQQLAYHGARVWARRYAPEIMLGVYAPEEMPEAASEPLPPARGPVIDAAAEFAPPAAEPLPWDVVTPKGVMRAKDADQWLAWCKKALSMCGDMDALDAWREAMQPHFVALTDFDADTVGDADSAARARRVELLASRNAEP